MKNLISTILFWGLIIVNLQAQQTNIVDKKNQAIQLESFIKSDNPELWGNLRKGIYDVGYHVAYEYDSSRTVKSKYNYLNELVTGNVFRPVQISVWYPSSLSANDQTMQYSEYIITRKTRFDYSLLNKKDIKNLINAFKKSVNWYNTSENKNNDFAELIINRETQAYKDASPYPGKFPLILFCSGGGDTPDSFDVLFEYLASHGYIIAAIPSNGMYKKSPSYNTIDEESQTRDMELAMLFMHKFVNADINNVCSMGYSYGGIVNVLFALRNFDIKTVLCLDGSICLIDRDRAVKNLAYFNPTNLRVPFMNLTGKQTPDHDFTFYNSLKYSDAYLLHFNNLVHYEFKSVPIIRNFENFKSDENSNISSIKYDNEIAYEYILKFLDSYMKNDSESELFIQNKPELNGITNGVVTVEFKKALDIPPTGTHFIELVENEGVDKGVEVYNKAKMSDSTIVMFGENEINTLGYKFLNEGLTDEAIKIFQLYVLEYPLVSNSYDSLGEAYERNNEHREALWNYKKALEINPNSISAKRAIQNITEILNK